MTESGKIVTATALSVLAHVSLFTVLALLPEAPLEATPPPPSLEEAAAEAPSPSLEVTLEAAAPVPPPQAAQPAVPPPAPEPAPTGAQAIRTQLDPENLRQSEEAPEHAQTLAAHNSKATPETAPTPSPTPAAQATNDPADLSLASKPNPTPGEIGIDALGHYGKAVGNAIGIRWNLHRKAQNPPLAVGEVRVQFILDAQGRASEITILSNTAGPANATVACKAVQEAKIPPIPPDRLAQVPGGRMRIVYSFTIYSSQ